MKSIRCSSQLSLQQLEHLESLCDRMDRSMQETAGDLEEILSGLKDPTRSYFLRELLWHDIERRQILGQMPCLKEYRFHRDSNQAIATEVFDQLANEQILTSRKNSHADSDAQRLPGRYEWINEIGRGGMGTIWSVRDRHSRRTLAIKSLRKRFRFDDQANLRLEREAISTGRLQHPGIPPSMITEH